MCQELSWLLDALILSGPLLERLRLYLVFNSCVWRSCRSFMDAFSINLENWEFKKGLVNVTLLPFCNDHDFIVRWRSWYFNLLSFGGIFFSPNDRQVLVRIVKVNLHNHWILKPFVCTLPSVHIADLSIAFKNNCND